MSQKYSYSDYLEGECTLEQYHAQFNPIELELGKEYVQGQGTWHEKIYKVVYIDNKVALAVTTANKISNTFINEYELFKLKTGFKYNDNRIAAYQLKELTCKSL